MMRLRRRWQWCPRMSAVSVLLAFMLTAHSNSSFGKSSPLSASVPSGYSRSMKADGAINSSLSARHEKSATFETVYDQVKYKGSGVEEQEAAVLECICISTVGILKSTFRITAVVIRRTGDTVAGLVSGTLKALAGAFKLSADGFWVTAMRLARPRAPDDRMPHLFDHCGRRVAKVLRTVANVFYGFAEACIMTGETTETLTIGLGQAVEDSFSSLEFLCASLQKGLTLLLNTDDYSHNAKDDLFHHQKRKAVLHAEASRAQQNTPLRLDVISDFKDGNHRPDNSHRTKKTGDLFDNTNRDPSQSSDGALHGASVNGQDDAAKGETEFDNAFPKSQFSSSSSSSNFFAYADSNNNNSNSNRTPRQHTEHSSIFNITSIHDTISQWQRYISVRPPSELMTYFNDGFSVCLLMTHVFWAWIAGPWTYIWNSQSTPTVSPNIGYNRYGDEVGLGDGGGGRGGGIGGRGSQGTGLQSLCALLIIAIASSIQYRSALRKMCVLLCLIIALWLSLMASEHVNIKMLTTRAAVSSINSLMLDKVARGGGGSYVPVKGSKSTAGGQETADDQSDNDASTYSNGGGGGGGGKRSGSSRTDEAGGINCSNPDCTAEQGRNARHTEDGTVERPLDFEISVWVNVVMAALWNVERTGGLGPYISSTIQGLVNEELALVPPGIANIQLKRFTLGTQQPVVQSVKVLSKRASICITPADQGTQRKRSDASAKEEKRKKASTSPSSQESSRKMDREERSDKEESVKGTKKKTDIKKEADKKTDMKEKGKEKEMGGIGESDKGLDRVDAVEVLGDRVAVLEPRAGMGSGSGSGVGRDWGQWEEWQSEWDRRHVKSPTFSPPSSSSPSSPTQPSASPSSSAPSVAPSSLPPHPSSSPSHRDRDKEREREGGKSGRTTDRGEEKNFGITRRPGGGNGCERLVMDLDFTYVSRDMDIVLTLRSSDVRSVLPEATVTLSGVVLSGVLRLDAELTPDYPFLGNATFSFVRPPTMDLSISSFGGLDLSSIPGVYSWVNITMTYLLGQFTDPSYGSVDLRQTICPLCDLPPPPTPREALAETVMFALHTAAQGASKIVDGARSLVDKAREVAGRILDVAEEVGSISSVARRMIKGIQDELQASMSREREEEGGLVAVT